MNRKFARAFSLAFAALVACGMFGFSACANSDDPVAVVQDDTGAPPSLISEGGADASLDGTILFNDGGAPDGQSCTPDAGGPGPISRICLPPTTNECDGKHDLPTYPANGTGGNGFDDDCDGLVDEGCTCEAAGITKDCYLVPASQSFGGKPAGWCEVNSKGTVDCVKPSSEFAGTWSGQCRGAQPAYADDFCAKGDFDCDGRDQNSKMTDCTCKGASVECPTDALTTIPYPPPGALPLKVDSASWFKNPGDILAATNWKWTLVGGDCDNILPHPTFAIYPVPSTTGPSAGTQSNTVGITANEHGMVATAPAVSSAVYPAFSLSGDYSMKGEFDLNGQHFACTQKIQVRAPGLRAEACWDTEGNGDSSYDIDLHMAQTTTVGASCPKKGWSGTCAAQDCYYGNCKSSASGPNWYPPNADNSVCNGWGSKTSGTCYNPRLDRDLITCDASQTNPNKPSFCGPENINVDAPGNGAKFAVGLRYFSGDAPARTHVNVYCNGERVLSTGYNPVTGNDFPKLLESGGDSSGDFWKVAMITTTVNAAGLSCAVDPVPSVTPHLATDGSNAYCVDNTATETADSAKYFTLGGFSPLNAPAVCFH